MLIGELPCEIIAVEVDKSYLTEYIATDDQLYAPAFRKLLDVIEERLESSNQPGMLMVDARSDLHSSVQTHNAIGCGFARGLTGAWHCSHAIDPRAVRGTSSHESVH